MRHRLTTLVRGRWGLWERLGVVAGSGPGTGWDFFVSYTQADRAWAEWIAWVLEEDGHRVLVQAWDFVPGSNWIQGMQAGVVRAERTIAVLSAAYLESEYASAEWQAAWAADPAARERKPPPLSEAAADTLAFNDVIATVVDYSLAKRTQAGLQLHRLVQAAC